ncbi:MAG: hypothetical protein ABL996_08095 [Micropepsaceae bacterium]
MRTPAGVPAGQDEAVFVQAKACARIAEIWTGRRISALSGAGYRRARTLVASASRDGVRLKAPAADVRWWRWPVFFRLFV